VAKKSHRWHIDYLLAAPALAVTVRSTDGECELNQTPAGTMPVAGFGASDCRAGRGSHLKYLD
jgi:Uri superfamily endonuclease